MILDILPLSEAAARLVRVYGNDPCAVLPEALPGPQGEQWALTELGDYCFSEKPRKLPAAAETCRRQRKAAAGLWAGRERRRKTPLRPRF